VISSYSQQWKEWCAGANPEGWVCDCLKFIMPVGPPITVGNKLNTQPTQLLRHEDGTNVTYVQCGFLISMPVKQMNMEYQLDVNMMPVHNDLLTVIANMNASALSQIIRVEHRIYLMPDQTSAPAIVPASKYYVSAITTARDGMNVICIPPTLSKKRAGEPYRLEEFAGLARF
jgi:hypothetical protein